MSTELSAAKVYEPPATTSTVVQGDSRPRIIAENRLITDIATEAGRELAKTGKVVVRDDNILVLDQCGHGFVAINPVRFVSWSEQFVVFQKYAGTAKKARLVDATISKTTAELILESHAFKTELPEVRRVNRVRLPVWRPTVGGLPRIELLPAGYDAETKTYTFVDVEYDEHMPVEDAFVKINKLLQDVAFDPADMPRSLSGVVAIIMTPFCDQLIDDAAPRPAFVVTANRDGAGKTFLVKLGLIAVYGIPSLTSPPAPDKMQEVLNAVVRDGKPYLFLDNWKGEVGGPAIEAFISGPRWTGRILGQSTTFDHEKRCLVFITGNNARLSNDGMRRRCIAINLFIPEARSEDRKVRQPLEERDLVERRAEILAALWAIVRYWRDGADLVRDPDGHEIRLQPFWRGKQNRSFGEWGEIVGGIVQSICSNQSPLDAPAVSHDQRLATWESFLTWFCETRADLLGDWLEFAALRDLACPSGLFEFLPDKVQDLSPEDKRKVDSILSKRFCQHYRNSTFNVCGGSIWFLDNGEIGRMKRYMVTRKPLIDSHQS